MTAKSYLSQIKWLDRKIENKLTEIYKLRVMITNATSIPIENDRIMKTKNVDILGDTIAKIVDKEKEVDKLVDKYIEKRDTIISQIDGMDDDIDLYNVLSKRYVAGDEFDDIAKKMDYTVRHIIRLHGKALAAFDRKYGDTYKSGR